MANFILLLINFSFTLPLIFKNSKYSAVSTYTAIIIVFASGNILSRCTITVSSITFSSILLLFNLPSNDLLINCIYFFHMPLFFVISGYFSKNIKKSRILDYVVLFFFMNTSFVLFDYFYYGKIDILNIKYSSWFILLLAIYRLIISNKKISEIIQKKYSLIIIFIISILSGIVFNNNTLVRLFSYFYFFALGYRNRFNIKKKYCYSFHNYLD